MFYLGVAGSLLLFVIAGFHFYWLFGGSVGTDRYIMADKNGGRIHIPKPVVFITALVFVAAALIPLIGLKVIELPLPDFLINFLLIFGIVVLSVRGIGGFVWSLTQRPPRDIFHQWNIKLYTPLCIFLAISYLACFMVFNA